MVRAGTFAPRRTGDALHIADEPLDPRALDRQLLSVGERLDKRGPPGGSAGSAGAPWTGMTSNGIPKTSQNSGTSSPVAAFGS